jgi:hypothetical protein
VLGTVFSSDHHCGVTRASQTLAFLLDERSCRLDNPGLDRRDNGGLPEEFSRAPV